MKIMREILFRAKAINRDPFSEYRTSYKNGDWVYGLITRQYDERFETLPAEMTNTDGVSGIDVDYKTIGQFTGLIDKNGKKIFEGDICHVYGGECYQGYWESNFNLVIEINHECLWFLDNAENVKVVGNKYDNPELLKFKEKGEDIE